MDLSFLTKLIDTSKLGGWVRALVASGLGILIAKWPGLSDILDPATQAELGAVAAAVVVGLWSHFAKSVADGSAKQDAQAIKKIVPLLLFALMLGAPLGGCAVVQKIEDAYNTVTSATVSTQQVKVAIDSFDALEVAATDLYLPLKHCSSTQGFPCRGDAKPVDDAIRAGRAARNNLKALLRSSVAGASGQVSSVDYNALATASGIIKAALTSYGINF